MKKTITQSIITTLLVLPLCFAFAQEEGKGKGKGGPEGGKGPGGPDGGMEPPKFADIDTNSSGDIDKEEWIAFQVASAKERAEKFFPMIAKDDEKISEAELKESIERRGGPGGKGRPDAGKGGPGGKEKGKGDQGKGKGEEPDAKRDEAKPARPAIEE